MLNDIIFTFDKNYKRITNLLEAYDIISEIDTKNPSKGDILRAIVVLTHSTFEDFLRSVLRWKLITEENISLDRIPMAGKGKNNTKILFGDIVKHKGISIDSLIEKSINEYLTSVSFNNFGDISKDLSWINFNVELVRKYYSTIDEMISRRHNIVHNADRMNLDDVSKSRVRRISKRGVKKWVKTVDDFVLDLSKELRK